MGGAPLVFVIAMLKSLRRIDSGSREKGTFVPRKANSNGGVTPFNQSDPLKSAWPVAWIGAPPTLAAALASLTVRSANLRVTSISRIGPRVARGRVLAP